MGKTLARIVIGSNGVVSEVKTITAHPVFKDYVVEALKKWRFTLSEQAHTLQITCIFEFEDYEKCEESGKFPANSETYISAELPTVVHIKRALPCFDINR